MRKMLRFLLILLASAAGLSAAAQSGPLLPPAPPVKEVLIVDLFARNPMVPPPYVEAVRQQVMSAFLHRGRQTVVDAAASSALSGGFAGPGIVDAATVAAAQARYLEERFRMLRQSDARYLVTGAIADYRFEHVQIPASGKNPPRQGFRSIVTVVISAYDLKLDKPIPGETYTLKADAAVAEQADMAAIGQLAGSMSYYIDRNFRFETIILELGAPAKKGAIKELYVHCGTDMGVEPGDTFQIYEEVPIGGVMTRQLVGRARVNDAHDRAVAKCKITKGGDEVVDAFRSGRPLICVSDTKAFGF